MFLSSYSTGMEYLKSIVKQNFFSTNNKSTNWDKYILANDNDYE